MFRKGERTMRHPAQSFHRILITITMLIALLQFNKKAPSVTVIALISNIHQRRMQRIPSPATCGYCRLYIQLQRQRRTPDSMQLQLMNWLGFGSNNSNNDNENGRASDSSLPPDTSSTMLLSSPSKDFTGKSSNSGAKVGSSSSGVVAIMDSMDQLKRSQRIGKVTATLVQELKSITVEGSSENGKIKIVFDGQQNPISTFIDESYFREQQRNNADPSELANAITTAMKDARMKSVEKMNEKMKNVYNELGFYNSSP